MLSYNNMLSCYWQQQQKKSKMNVYSVFHFQSDKLVGNVGHETQSESHNTAWFKMQQMWVLVQSNIATGLLFKHSYFLIYNPF